DEKAKGTIYGEGVGVVLLKRLKDARADGDTIKCIIKASAVNNDGTGKASFTAPGKKRIADVIRTVLKLSRVDPEDIGYIEAHGTATSLGDAIELEALKEAFAAGKKGYCGIGSVKSNIGHLDVAAGIASFIKTVLTLMHRLIPPTLHFESPNPKMDFINSPFYVNNMLSPWEDENQGETDSSPLKAGVCSFGVGGTNAFVLLEGVTQGRAHSAMCREQGAGENSYQLLLLSARTDSALDKMTGNMVEYLKKNPGVNLADAAYTLQVGRRGFNRRRMVVCSTVEEAIAALSSPGDRDVQTSEGKGKGRFGSEVPGLMDKLLNAFQPGPQTGEAVETLKEIGMAWLKGAKIGWQEFYARYLRDSNQERFRISLPTYPFERQRYWIDVTPLEFFTPDPGAQIERINSRVETEPEAVVPVEEKVLAGLYPRPPLSTEYAAPGDEVEQALVGVWQKFFGIQEVGIYDDFFELGGDSLKAITVVLEIHKRMDTRIPITEIFQSPTIRELAEYIKGAETDQYSAIEPVEQKEYYPLSSVQKRIYILQQIETGSTGYNNPLIFEMEGQLDKERLENAFSTLVSRHESLRTSFELIEGETVQRIHQEVEFEVEYFDLTTEDTEGSPRRGGHHSSLIIHHFVRPFDLSKAPLLRVGLVRRNEENHILMTDMNHIITDGSSIGILVREFMTLYTDGSLAPLPIHYKDYTQWQNSDNQIEAMKKQEAYWLKVFEDEIPVLNLPTDYVRPAIQSFEGSTKRFIISREETEALKEVASCEDATLFMILLSIYNIMLEKICGQEDIVVGTPLAARTHADLQPIIGMLVNTLAFRNYPSEEKTFRQFLREVKETTLAGFENQDYLFEDLVEQVTEKAKVNRDVSRNPVFDTMFNLLNIQSQYEANLEIKTSGLSLKLYEHDKGRSIFDMIFQGGEEYYGLSFTVDFCTKLFKPETIDRFIGYFKKIASTVVASADIKLSEIEIISGEERSQILYDFNSADTSDVFREKKLIHRFFEEQVEKRPDAAALVFEDKHLTYKELNKKSHQLGKLLRLKGVGPDVVVGVMVERSFEMIIGILGILKAGGAYLPIDPEYPQERIDYMLTDSGARVLLKKSEIRISKFETNPNDQNSNDQNEVTTSIVLDFEHLNFEFVSDFEFRASNLSSLNLVYVIYTSGSTGIPKGSLLEHRNLVNLILYQYRYTNIDFSRVLQFATISFDVSFQEIFSTLSAGGTLVLVSEKTIKNIPKLFEVIEKNQIRTLFLPASLLKFIFNEQEYASLFPGCVDHIAAAGEQLIVIDRFREYLKANNIYLHNHYGPTEAHVVTALTIDPRSEIPALPSIGKPLVNTNIYIVDKGMHLQPPGIAGELIIGGVQPGRGYLNRLELTNEKFLRGSRGQFLQKEPPGRRRLYKTGDLARWLSGGIIEFLGRLDHQVKIRGFRIEPGEIESLLMDMDEIKEAVVIARDKTAGEKYLCAYIVPDVPRVVQDETKADVTVIKSKLSKVLPDYMIPAYFVTMDDIPLTPNGKVNRKTLPEPDLDAAGERMVPRNMVEIKLTELWAEVLGIEKELIGIDSDFFQLGGHSLNATILTSKIHKHFHVEVMLGEMFRQPTIRELANYIKGAEEDRYMAIERMEMREYYPLSSAQKRLYILQQMDLESTVYNMPEVLKLRGGIDEGRLEQVFRQMIHRHESFRTSFITVNEEPVQRIHHDVDFEIEYYSLERRAESVELSSTSYAGFVKSFIRPFDLSKAPLLRAGLAKMEEEGYLVMVDIHHIVSDGVSNRKFVREFMRLFFGGTLQELRVQYKDYAWWQNSQTMRRKKKSQEEYWLREFSGEIPVLNLAYDGPRPAIQSFEGSCFVFEVGKEETTALNRLAQDWGVTLFMILIAGFNILLSKFSGQEDIVIGTPTAGRVHADLEHILGMFVNTLPLRNYPKVRKTFLEFLFEVKTKTLQAFENQDYQFEDLVEKVAVRRDASRSPLFDVMFALQNLEERVETAAEDAETNQFITEYEYEKWVSRFDMTWGALEKETCLS
nr:amino acid adenylation domain-containing protein [Candidatus Aminicenantes bacterium]NIM81938.1 amino acid adenylation domain-containing protein [Candidatus Aminicenantes bacterium]NIN21663.1 amino acid adenylation domain-containing protein [Candidatus Aminicenantes bacterium]NIN45458.1 amino acid adenylation domain-containing protein [Candidatus Aminicenantes bacterium]NIN88290.1 amino acid adenylation domain-containing protein [Candidatus Aminicenantes bacterium]